MPVSENEPDVMEKGTAANHISRFYSTARFDPVTLQPIRPDGMTDEEFERTLPDSKTERFLIYLRGMRNRKGPEDCTNHASEQKGRTRISINS